MRWGEPEWPDPDPGYEIKGGQYFSTRVRLRPARKGSMQDPRGKNQGTGFRLSRLCTPLERLAESIHNNNDEV